MLDLMDASARERLQAEYDSIQEQLGDLEYVDFHTLPEQEQRRLNALSDRSSDIMDEIRSFEHI